MSDASAYGCGWRFLPSITRFYQVPVNHFGSINEFRIRRRLLRSSSSRPPHPRRLVTLLYTLNRVPNPTPLLIRPSYPLYLMALPYPAPPPRFFDDSSSPPPADLQSLPPPILNRCRQIMSLPKWWLLNTYDLGRRML